MPSRLISYGLAWVMSLPSIVMLPALFCTVPVMARSIVVLPTPLRPSSATASPSCTTRSRSVSTCCRHIRRAAASSSSSGFASRTGRTISVRTVGTRAACTCRTHIGRDHVWIAGNLGRLAVGDHAALVQHGNAVRQRQHAIDVVLDQQHGVGRGELADQRADHLAVGFGQAGQRFVEQQQLRIGGQRDGDFQQPPLAVREVGAWLGRAILQPDRGQQRPGARVDVLDARRRRATERSAAGCAPARRRARSRTSSGCGTR